MPFLFCLGLLYWLVQSLTNVVGTESFALFYYGYRLFFTLSVMIAAGFTNALSKPEDS
jgi:O-antigen/teichoic acid export membrane protein